MEPTQLPFGPPDLLAISAIPPTQLAHDLASGDASLETRLHFLAAAAGEHALAVRRESDRVVGAVLFFFDAPESLPRLDVEEPEPALRTEAARGAGDDVTAA